MELSERRSRRRLGLECVRVRAYVRAFGGASECSACARARVRVHVRVRVRVRERPQACMRAMKVWGLRWREQLGLYVHVCVACARVYSPSGEKYGSSSVSTTLSLLLPSICLAVSP